MKTSKAAAGVCNWLKNIYLYYNVVIYINTEHQRQAIAKARIDLAEAKKITDTMEEFLPFYSQINIDGCWKMTEDIYKAIASNSKEKAELNRANEGLRKLTKTVKEEFRR